LLHSKLPRFELTPEQRFKRTAVDSFAWFYLRCKTKPYADYNTLGAFAAFSNDAYPMYILITQW